MTYLKKEDALPAFMLLALSAIYIYKYYDSEIIYVFPFMVAYVSFSEYRLEKRIKRIEEKLKS
ncbi:hypothetical protein [Photobacterium lutimaris]|uniref:hypothetical protein n=1 Tax=Photobacterium lutimaris TaxID=388278 RepID=UPI001061794A|nr:hypothetical protein [Photobacterium lutimaris]TDR76016.1 hypothetical protein DFP78_1031 [Photobacterium lutimaris]